MDELKGVLEDANTSREDLVKAAVQLGRLEGRAEGRAEGLAERQLLQHLLTMESEKSAIIIDHMTQQLRAHQKQAQSDKKELRMKTAEIDALRCELLSVAVLSMYDRSPMASCAVQALKTATWYCM